MRVRDHTEHPAPVRSALVGKVEQYESTEDIVGVEFSLQRHATLIGPTSISALSSKTKANETVLAALHSLIHAPSITFFVPRNGNAMNKIEALCSEACNGGLKASATEYSLAMLYGGSGGKDVGSLLARFDPEESEGPPSYDELALTPPPMRQRKRMPSSRISPPPAKKHASTIEPRLPAASEVQALKQQMAGLVAEVAELRGRVGEAACSEKEDTSVISRLNAVETVVSALKTRVEEMEATLRERSASREQSVERQIIDKFEDQLEERIEDVRSETRVEINDQLDDMLTDIKVELRDWVQEELRDLVSQQLGELVEEYLTNASFTVERH
ncbi:hypothetical protein SLS56_010393 [Neofusicoccum ribis]|uniref:Uncharacterized protein n=1 Tax=Neofusicoccum ribis TaxID=45134 RepID=A0ABR3SFD8_9PEZI